MAALPVRHGARDKAGKGELRMTDLQSDLQLLRIPLKPSKLGPSVSHTMYGHHKS